MEHSVPPLPPASVPILGQPCKIVAFCGPQVTIVCNCELKAILLLNGFGIPAQCPGCRRGRVIFGFTADMSTGQITVNVTDVAMPEPAKVTA